MMRDGNPNAFTRQVHFANGFPPKGFVQDASPYGVSPYASPRGHYVSLDEVSPRVGRTHRTVPPLAKGRGQFCSMKDRPEDDRYRRRPDPFKLPKAAEKTGFSASQIKHAKPRTIRMCRSTEPPAPPPATATVYNSKNLARRAVYSTPPNRPLDIDLEDDFVTPVNSVELKSKNSKIISVVEKESIQAELAGLEEVYQRVCCGKIESLYSLLYPSRRDAKRGPVQYINTSAPVQLRTPKIAHHQKKPAKVKEAAMSSVDSGDAEVTHKDETAPITFPGSEHDTKNENGTRPILIPLPYIRSDISVTTSGKQQKPIYNVPYVYSNRANKAAMRHSHALNNTSPAVINFNPMNIPELSRPGTKNGIPAGSKTTSLSKTASVTVSHSPVPMSALAPFLSSPGPVKGTTPNQTPAQFDGKGDDIGMSGADAEEKLGKLDIDSIDSEVDYTAQFVVADSVVDSNVQSGDPASKETKTETVLDVNEKSSNENCDKEIVAEGIHLSLTTDGGLVGGLEIYDYNKRDVESEEQAAKLIEELEHIGEQNIREYTELLEEHQHILDEVKQLEDELHKPSE